MFREGYRDTSLDKGTGPVQGGVQWVQPCTGWGGGGVQACTEVQACIGVQACTGRGTWVHAWTGVQARTGGGGGGGVQACTEVQACTGVQACTDFFPFSVQVYGISYFQKWSQNFEGYKVQNLKLPTFKHYLEWY